MAREGGRRRLFTASANNVTAVGARSARASPALAHKSSRCGRSSPGAAPLLPEAPPAAAGRGGAPQGSAGIPGGDIAPSLTSLPPPASLKQTLLGWEKSPPAAFLSSSA